jgi:hypothetical protein
LKFGDGTVGEKPATLNGNIYEQPGNKLGDDDRRKG